MAPLNEHIEAEDARFQRFDSLRRNRNQRHRQKLFLVEGVRQIDGALAGGWTVRAFLYRSDASLSGWATKVLATSRAQTHYALPSGLLSKLSGKNESSELIAVVEMPADDPERIVPATLPLLVVVDRSNSHGNLGTIIRSCDALGADGLFLTGHAVDLYDPQTIAASTGSIFALPVVRARSHRELQPFFERLRREHGDLQLIGTSARGSRVIDQVGFLRPTVLLVGNETDGLSYAYQELADEMVAIPMRGAASSLNVAPAVAILLYEVQRQREK